MADLADFATWLRRAGFHPHLGRRRAKPASLPEHPTRTDGDVLRAFIAEEEAILQAARRVDTTDAALATLLDDFHDRVLLFALRRLGRSSVRRLHDHDGVRRFVPVYPASLTTQRIRLCRHLETDLLRLHEFLARTEPGRSGADSWAVELGDDASDLAA